MKIFKWIIRIVPALILLQTLYFKFTGAPESVYIFETLGMEPWGRYGSGVAELIAAVLMVIPSFSGIGSLLGLGVMFGAIASHLLKLGIEVQEDGGILFILAVIVFLCCAVNVYLERKQIPVVKNFFKS